jgi:hypothetical protein
MPRFLIKDENGDPLFEITVPSLGDAEAQLQPGQTLADPPPLPGPPPEEG